MRLPKVTTVRAAIAVAAVGVAVFFIGLWHPFMGDDIQQIVNNPLAHSAKHIPSFFSGGTFYDDNGNGQLSGVFYRPLMMTVYALIYTVFGAHPVMFHVVQMLLFVGAACFLFLILQYFLYPSLALGLALVFLSSSY